MILVDLGATEGLSEQLGRWVGGCGAGQRDTEGLIGAGLELVQLVKVNPPDRGDVTKRLSRGFSTGRVVLWLQVMDGMVQLLPVRAHTLG